MQLIFFGVVILGTGALVLLGTPELFAGLPVIGGLVKFSTSPAPGAPVTQAFKPPPNGHNGIDFGVPIGTPMRNVAPGVVLQVRNDPDNNSGRFVIVKGRVPFTPTIAWGYAHLSRVDVTVGQQLEPGDVIGLSGNSGLTQSSDGALVLNRTDGRGAHLHFTVLDVPRGLQSLDPKNFLPDGVANA